ncbi:opsin-5 [Protopterus annectens]|uniref:opsin-5 n=1 Tax=Protopterus annectens TaxID=7888 RepID=UPI001CFB41DE|nr:opsin-5 [Protopterus annectens]
MAANCSLIVAKLLMTPCWVRNVNLHFLACNLDVRMTLNDSSSSKQSGYVPHYILHQDPFASKLSWEADIIAALYLVIIGVLSTLGNGYVLLMAFRQKKKLKPPEIMTSNLALFDFGISVTGKPFLIISCFLHRWAFGWAGCRWYGWAGFFFGCGSLVTMTVVSLDRYLKICHLRYATWIQRHHVFICMALVWLYVGFWATMPLVGWGNYAPEPFGTSCTLDWWQARASVRGQSFVLCILFFCLVFPVVIIVFSYIKIIAKVKSTSKEVSHFDARNQNSHVLEMKLTKVAMLICTGFLVAWIPYAIVSVWSAFGDNESIPLELTFVPTMLAKSSAMYNPIIYQVMNCKAKCMAMCCNNRQREKEHFQKSRLYTIATDTRSSTLKLKASEGLKAGK